MYCINGTDSVFDTLLTENDRYCFNLFYRIREDTGAYIATGTEALVFLRRATRIHRSGYG